MHIAAEHQKVFVAFYQLGLVSLKKMAVATVAETVVHGIGSGQALHELPEVHRRPYLLFKGRPRH